MSAVEAIVWEGDEGLRDALVPLAQIDPVALAEPPAGTLERGQKVAVVCDLGLRVAAGRHLVAQAVVKGWTHLAVRRADLNREELERHAAAAVDDTSHMEVFVQLEKAGRLEGASGEGGWDQPTLDLGDEFTARVAPAVVAPDGWPLADPADMHTQYECPHCGYGWNGRANARVA